MASLYNKYYDILKSVYNIMNLTDDVELKESCKKTIINTINQLIEKDASNKKVYENILEEFGFTEKNIETPIKEKDNIPSEVQEELPSDKKHYNTIDEYIFYEIYRNKNKLLGDEFQKIMIDLIKSIKNGDEEDILLNKNKYDKFVENNKSIIDVKKMKEYFQKTCDEYKVLKEEIPNEEKKQEESLKIKNVKRSYNSQIKNKALSLLALAGTGKHNQSLSNGIGVGGYYLYKKGIKNAKSLIERNGLRLDENDNLVDSNGKLINEEEIGKLKYNLIKRELSKINNKGIIDANYKKNKLTSMLLSVPSKMFTSIKDKYKQIKISRENESDEVKDINKGLGIIK